MVSVTRGQVSILLIKFVTGNIETHCSQPKLNKINK